MLYHADRLGYMVWGECGNWGLDISGTEGLARFLPEWMEALARDFNHPSIIGWCPFNETFDVPFEAPRRAQEDAVLRNGFAVTKALDPTRPVLDTSSFHHVINTSQELMMIAFGSCVSTILLSLFRYNIKKTSDGVSAEVNVTIREEHPKVLQHILLFLIHSKDLTIWTIMAMTMRRTKLRNPKKTRTNNEHGAEDAIFCPVVVFMKYGDVPSMNAVASRILPAIFLILAAGFIRQRHLNQTLFKRRVKIAVHKCRPVP